MQPLEAFGSWLHVHDSVKVHNAAIASCKINSSWGHALALLVQIRSAGLELSVVSGLAQAASCGRTVLNYEHEDTARHPNSDSRKGVSDARCVTYRCQIWQMRDGHPGSDAPHGEYDLARSSTLSPDSQQDGSTQESMMRDRAGGDLDSDAGKI